MELLFHDVLEPQCALRAACCEHALHSGMNDQVSRTRTVGDLSTEIFTKWWPGLSENDARVEIIRNCYNVNLALASAPPDAWVCDIGAGWGAFSCTVKGLGYRSTMIDDFRDSGFYSESDPRYKMQQHFGVDVVSRDVIADGLNMPDNSLDVVGCFDSMEHWHNSPKKLFAEIMRALKPGGRFVLGVPNCVNLRKRFSTLIGTARWTDMNDWYEQPVFRGHVREPSVPDLYYIARDMGLDRVQIHGENFAGMAKPSLKLATAVLNPVLKLKPSLCSEIYLTGHRPLGR